MAGTILLTGASGYAGSRLLRVLEEGGYRVRCLAREPGRVTPRSPTTAVVAGDCVDEATVVAALGPPRSRNSRPRRSVEFDRRCEPPMTHEGRPRFDEARVRLAAGEHVSIDVEVEE